MTGNTGPLWDRPRAERRAIVTTFNGIRARIRFSLDGSLDRQAVIYGVVHVRDTDLTIFHVQRDQTQPNSQERRYTPVIFARVIDISAAPTIGQTVPAPYEQRRRTDACQNCLGIDQPPDNPGPHHCGTCPCCRPPAA